MRILLLVAAITTEVFVWTTGLFVMFMQEAPHAVEPISGGAGWIGAGLLGLVLGWLLLKHLPDKDKQIRDLLSDKDAQIANLMTASSNERTAERVARHDIANKMQSVVKDMHDQRNAEFRLLTDQHRADANEDRKAFLDRNDRVEDAIKAQTVELRNAMISVLREYLQK